MFAVKQGNQGWKVDDGYLYLVRDKTTAPPLPKGRRYVKLTAKLIKRAKLNGIKGVIVERNDEWQPLPETWDEVERP